MSEKSAARTIIYLAQGKLRVKTGETAPRTVDSAYGNSIREKEVRSQQRHSWKGGGGDSPFSNVVWGKQRGAQDVPLSITSVCGGRGPGGLIYSLESGSLCALLEAEQLGADERRLWNDNRTRIRHVTVSRPAGDLAFAVLHENGTANIGLKLNGESGVREMTEGDSFDTAPHWVPGAEQKIVFQSAGIGRNREGQFLALGPFSIQQMEIATGDMSTLLEDKRCDYLAPQYRADGTLLCIRRPYTLQERMNPLTTLKDFFMLPLRLLFVVFQFLNFLSAAFTGKQLTSSPGADAKQMNMRQMMVWGNLVHAQQGRRGPQEEGIGLVPKSWELCERNARGELKPLANGVLAYDVEADGTIVYTNGNALFLLSPDGRKERLLSEDMIEQVFFVPA